MSRWLVVLLSCLLVFGFTGLSLAQEVIDVQGSTTVLPVMQIVAEEFMAQNPEIEITVSGGGSGVGISALLDGVVPVAMSSRKIKPEEMETAQNLGLDIKEVPIALDAIAVVVNPANPLEEISLELLRNIYTGEIKTWEEVGTHAGEIAVISRDTASGTFEVFNEHVLQGAELSPEALRLSSNRAVLEEVARNPQAIGYIGLAYVSQSVKPVQLEGVFPSEETAKSGEYLLSRTLYLYLAREAEGSIAELVDFILSEEGQKIVEEAGFVSVN